MWCKIIQNQKSFQASYQSRSKYVSSIIWACNIMETLLLVYIKDKYFFNKIKSKKIIAFHNQLNTLEYPVY